MSYELAQQAFDAGTWVPRWESAKDICQKSKAGDLSDAQKATVARAYAEDTAPKGTVPLEDAAELTAKVAGKKGKKVLLLVDGDDGPYKLWGTLDEAEKGMEIEITCKTVRSNQDESFGFFDVDTWKDITPAPEPEKYPWADDELPF